MSTLFAKGCPAASNEAHREKTSANWKKVALKGDKPLHYQGQGCCSIHKPRQTIANSRRMCPP